MHLSRAALSNTPSKSRIWRYCWELKAVHPKSRFTLNLPSSLRLMCLFSMRGNISKTKSSCTTCWRNTERGFLWVYQLNFMKKWHRFASACQPKVQRELLKIPIAVLKYSCHQILLISCRKTAITLDSASGPWSNTTGIHHSMKFVDSRRTWSGSVQIQRQKLCVQL